MTYYTNTAAENLIQQYYKLGGDCLNVCEGCLTCGFWICKADGYKWMITKEVYLNSQSSGVKIHFYSKLPAKYQKYWDMYEDGVNFPLDDKDREIYDDDGNYIDYDEDAPRKSGMFSLNSIQERMTADGLRYFYIEKGYNKQNERIYRVKTSDKKCFCGCGTAPKSGIYEDYDWNGRRWVRGGEKYGEYNTYNKAVAAVCNAGKRA